MFTFKSKEIEFRVRRDLVHLPTYLLILSLRELKPGRLWYFQYTHLATKAELKSRFQGNLSSYIEKHTIEPTHWNTEV